MARCQQDGKCYNNPMNEQEKSNQAMWNSFARFHPQTEFYDVAGFKAGKISLRPLEIEEVGDVNGQSLLHLQCHFGMDTLSWARRGAQVTGVDFAEEAIQMARSLSQEIGMPAQFVLSPIFDLPQVLEGQFDIVFSSYGVLCWLSDLARWAQVIAHFLKPGGFFYIIDGHPFGNVFYNEPDATHLRVAYPYFPQPEPERYPFNGSYAGEADLHGFSYEWSHSLGEIINSLLAVGLRLEFLHEFPFAGYRHLPFMVQGEDDNWYLPELNQSVPLLFSLKAVKPAIECQG